MNEDQQYDAAEREMDLYRAEITRITAERDDYAARLKATDESWAEVAAERDRLADAVVALTKAVKGHERVMFAAAIDIRRGQPGAARLLLGEQLGGWDGMPPWDGTETGAEYLERTGGGPPDD